MIGYIIFAIWVIIGLAAAVSFAIWKIFDNDDARTVSIICTAIFGGIVIIVVVVILFTGLELLSNIVNWLLG